VSEARPVSSNVNFLPWEALETDIASASGHTAEPTQPNHRKENVVSQESDQRPVNLKAFGELPPDAPVVMINLLRFKEGSGRDSYLQYTREVQPHLEKVGGSVRYAGSNPVNIIGDGEHPWWDAILVVEYPSPQAFVDMVTDPGYQQVHEHRAAALTQGDLVATSQWTLS